MTTIELRKEAAALSVAEKIQLVEDLWDDIALASDDWPLSDAQKSEMNRRIEDFERNPREGLSWPQTRQEILGRK